MDLEQVKQQMLLDYKARKDPPWLFDHTIFLTIHGSQAYGLARPDSDFDIAGICVPPKNYFFGFLNSFEQAQSTNPDGAVYGIKKFMQLASDANPAVYGIKKFMQLASDANPNVMELLWIDPKFWIITSTVHEKLLENRELFLSAKVRFTYSGYAHQQLNRIKLHKRHLLSPPTHRPFREEFNLPETRIISRDQQGALNALQKENKLEISNENFLLYLQQENKYQRAVQEWDQYQSWKKNRNIDRANLEAKYGYDTKHGMHLVRLMRQCKEILSTGEVLVLRPDREELLAIRDGAWSYEKIVEYAESEDKNMDTLYESTKLPKQPNRNKIDTLCQQIIEEHLYEK